MRLRCCLLILITVLAVLSSGCTGDQDIAEQGSVEPVVSLEPAVSPPISQVEQDKLAELETKIDSMQQQINELETRIDRVDLLEPSEKKLIPPVPFKIEVYFTDWQTPLVYLFKESELEIRDRTSVEFASYRLHPDNNTIEVISKKYNYYGLVLYDDYITAIYDNGWIQWVHRYKLIPPKFNTVKQRYELN